MRCTLSRGGAATAMAVAIVIIACGGDGAGIGGASVSLEGATPAFHQVACVGDSITFGDGPSLFSTAWPALLQSMLGEDWAVENDGHVGATMSKGGDIPYWNAPELASARAWVEGGGDVVILLGTNDARADNWTPSNRASFLEDCTELVDLFRATSPRTRVWIGVVPPATDAACCGMASNIENGVVPLLETCAAAKDVPLIDIHSAIVAEPGVLFDGLHPDRHGRELIARKVADALTAPPRPPTLATITSLR